MSVFCVHPSALIRHRSVYFYILLLFTFCKAELFLFAVSRDQNTPGLKHRNLCRETGPNSQQHFGKSGHSPLPPTALQVTDGETVS